MNVWDISMIDLDGKQYSKTTTNAHAYLSQPNTTSHSIPRINSLIKEEKGTSNSTFLSFFHCTLSLLDPKDKVGILVQADDVSMVQSNRDSRKSCDFSAGKWVYDGSYPLYDSNCPYLSSAVTCQKNGRPDSDYEKWKWKPSSCTMPRFDALRFLGRMRRKRIMLVGDSIMRNQWESLVCLVQGVIPTGRKRVTYNGPAMAFHAMTRWDYYVEGNNLIRNMNPMVAYQKGLSTWARWVDRNLDPQRTQVIFRSMSPRHNR
ncbi:trichome birefringence 36 [Spatholobus suberectus]|nr:trichome birefringence 36 [Spatholobus suberectus]